MDNEVSLRKAVDKLSNAIDRRDYYIEKRAMQLAKTFGKGVLSNFYDWTGKGIGQLSRLAGRALGAKSVVSLRGPDGTIYRIGDVVKGVGGAPKRLTIDNIKSFVNKNNAVLQRRADKLGKVLNDSQRYSLISETLGGDKATGILSLIGNLGTRLSKGGDKLVKWGDDLDNWYKKDLFAGTLGEKGKLSFLKRNALRFAAGATPLGVAPAATYFGDDSAAGKSLGVLNNVINYGSPAMLAMNGVIKGMEAYGNSMNNATLDGAALGAGLVAGKLAETNPVAFLGGTVSPTRFARKVNNIAQAELNMLRANPNQYLQ